MGDDADVADTVDLGHGAEHYTAPQARGTLAVTHGIAARVNRTIPALHRRGHPGRERPRASPHAAENARVSL